MSGYVSNVDRLYEFDPFSIKTGIPLEDIADLYVPFDELMNYEVIEGKMVTELKKQTIGKFYGIIGKSGSGKSSTLNYLLAEMSKNGSKTFCIKLNNFSDEIKEPRDLLRNVVKKIYDMTLQFTSLTNPQKQEAAKVLAHSYSFSTRKERKISFGLKAWFDIIPLLVGIKPEFSVELKKQTEIVTKSEPSIEDLLVYLDQIVDILKNKAGMSHIVIMFDETDKIHQPGESEPSVDSAIRFFGNNLPILEKTGCSFIFIMNEQYENEKFKKMILDSYFSPILKVPTITSKKSMEMIIEKRTRAACGGVRLNEIWDEGTMDLLYSYYDGKSLRELMPICNISIQKARDCGSETISVNHLKNAMMEFTSS